MTRILSIVVIFVQFLVCTSICFGGQATETIQSKPNEEAHVSLEALEALAGSLVSSGNPSGALDVYRRYEIQMVEEGWSEQQPDLLVNMAIAAYRAGKFGLSMALIRQHYIWSRDSTVREAIDEIQMLIEHRVYQKSPNTAFVRGQSDDYMRWEGVHYYSAQEIRVILLVIWSSIFIVLGIFLFVARISRRRSLLLLLLIIEIVLLFSYGGISLRHSMTEGMRFGVLTEVSSLRTTPGMMGTRYKDDAFVPGMVVGIVTSVPGWVQVRRVDGVTAWLSSAEVYVLRGKGESGSHRLE